MEEKHWMSLGEKLAIVDKRSRLPKKNVESCVCMHVCACMCIHMYGGRGSFSKIMLFCKEKMYKGVLTIHFLVLNS